MCLRHPRDILGGRVERDLSNDIDGDRGTQRSGRAIEHTRFGDDRFISRNFENLLTVFSTGVNSLKPWGGVAVLQKVVLQGPGAGRR